MRGVRRRCVEQLMLSMVSDVVSSQESLFNRYILDSVLVSCILRLSFCRRG